jgi:hypothetical protein
MPNNTASPILLKRLQRRAIRFWGRNWSWVVLLAGVVAVLTLQTLHWSFGLRITGALVASTVTFELNETLDAAPDLLLEPPKAALQGTTWIRPPSELGTDQIPVSWAYLSAAALRLSEVHFGQGTLLTVEKKGTGEFVAAAHGAGGTLKFAANGPIEVKLPNSLLANREAIAGLECSIGAVGDVPEPLLLRASSKAALVLEDVAVSDIHFGRRRDVGNGFVSSIVSGSIKLVDVGTSETLEPGSALKIEEFRGEVVRLEGTEGGYRVWFTGRAKRVRLGPPGFDKDITPSILEFLYHQESIQLIWLIAFAGLAAVMKVRSWIVNKSDG